ncbi:putative epoxide hydrolase [Planoprotostelium fungivorum]|uniref:Putative epoxide hydrolase n=1 Tax=Planoprotostelium fungivorum TaxID=1890364 RepID=A0A2P6NT24_9EUKA|nr:putative epoxide hydrolase [Planoprotostelium fungivorum]
MDREDDPQSYHHHFIQVNGVKLHYVEEGTGPNVLWYGWRYQIRYLAKKGYRVIVPDMRGYGQSESPRFMEGDMSVYSWKTKAKDISDMMSQLHIPSAVLIGHDWGSHWAQRVAKWYPDKVKALVLISVPYSAPMRFKMSLRQIVDKLPNFKYQITFAEDKKFEETVNADPRPFFTCLFRYARDSVPMDFEGEIPKLKRSEMVSQQALDYYVEQYKKATFYGSLACYKLTSQSYEEEKNLPRSIETPIMMITTGHDQALPPMMAQEMPKTCKHLTMKHIEDAAHWVMVERPKEINQLLSEFIPQFFSKAKL